MELVLAAIGLDPVVTDQRFRVRQYNRDDAAALPGKIHRSIARFLGADEPAAEGKGPAFKYREVLDMLIEERTPEIAQQIASSFADTDEAIQFTAAVGRVLTYLKDSLPKRVRNTPFGPTYDAPNAQVVARFKRAHAVANDPLEALRHLEEGDLVADEVTALSAMWPGVYGLIKRDLFEQLARIREARPHAEMRHAKVRLLSKLMGVSAWSDETIRAAQESYAEESKEQAAEAQRSQPLRDLGQQTITPVQRVAQK